MYLLNAQLLSLNTTLLLYDKFVKRGLIMKERSFMVAHLHHLIGISYRLAAHSFNNDLERLIPDNGSDLIVPCYFIGTIPPLMADPHLNATVRYSILDSELQKC